MAKGKKYFNRKELGDRPLGDFYITPTSLPKVLLNNEYFDPKGTYLDPCCGEGAISNLLASTGRAVTAFDLYSGENKRDFFSYNTSHDYIIMNPPFSQFDLFVEHGKNLTKRKMAVIGRMNYFACVGRSRSGIWEGLSSVHVFNRMVDYRGPYREDGKFHVGGLVTAWFVYDKGLSSPDPVLKILNVQEFACLGQFKEVGDVT